MKKQNQRINKTFTIVRNKKDEEVNKMERKVKGNKNGKFYVPAWVTRGVGLAVNAILLMQITFYATESVGLSAGVVGMLLLVSKLFDGVTDLIAGFIIDKTHTKWGKARPYELFLIPTWILTVMLFSTPNNMGTTAKAVYIFVLYLLINAVCVTFLSASEAVYLARSTSDDNRRAHALTATGICAMLFPAMISIALPILMAKWGNQPGGWTKIALVLGVPSCIVGLIRFLYIKEEQEVETEKESQISVKESLGCLAQNKYIFILAGIVLFSMVATNVVSASQTYYFTYIVGDLAMMSMIGVLGLAAPFVLLLFPVALRKIGGMNFVKIGAALAIIGSVLKYFAGANMQLIILGSLLAGVGTSVITMIGNIFVIQCMDYGEWKTGVRVEGILNSVTGFAGKVGSGLSSGLVGLIMGIAGYVGGAATQTASANTAIVWCFSLIPAILCLIMFILCCFYDLEKKEGKIREDLEKRHAQQ